MSERIASANSAVIPIALAERSYANQRHLQGRIALAERSYANQRHLQERIVSANSMAGLCVQFPAQVIDGKGRGGMIGGRVFTAVSGDRLFNGMIIRTVFFVQ